jgi:hypothetical protein
VKTEFLTLVLVTLERALRRNSRISLSQGHTAGNLFSTQLCFLPVTAHVTPVRGSFVLWFLLYSRGSVLLMCCIRQGD